MLSKFVWEKTAVLQEFIQSKQGILLCVGGGLALVHQIVVFVKNGRLLLTLCCFLTQEVITGTNIPSKP
jgi:hypothetical protein